MKRPTRFLALLLFPVLGSAEVKLPSIFSDHMVVQREKPVAVWGWAAPGETVSVRLGDGSAVKTEGDAQGRWRVSLPPLPAGGPHELVAAGTNTVAIKDVLVGEVWVCSGQSNMEWTVKGSDKAAEEIAAANHPRIRHIKYPKQPAEAPVDDRATAWEVCSPETAPNFTAVGYFFARHLQGELDVPIGLINASWGGTRIEPWTAPAGFAEIPSLANLAKPAAPAAPAGDGKEKKKNHQQPSALFNGMVAPFVGYGIRGALWYQGESNHGEGAIYLDKKRALIGGWRKLWNQGDFPFYFVQIAPFQYGNEDPLVLPAFWEVQASCLSIPNTGMAVIHDVGNLQNIHPGNKQEVGRRLALIALAKDYGEKDVVYSGPMFKSLATEGKTLRVSFEHTGGGLASRDGKPLSHFEIKGAGTDYVPADAVIDGNTVKVSSPKVENPLAVRFAWHKLAEPNLMNKAGLPAAPFRAGEPKEPAE